MQSWDSPALQIHRSSLCLCLMFLLWINYISESQRSYLEFSDYQKFFFFFLQNLFLLHHVSYVLG